MTNQEVLEILKNNNAAATIKLRDVLKLCPNALDILQMKTPEQTEKLLTVFKGKFNQYEIGGETIAQFIEFLKDVYDENIYYYQELIDVYEQQINYLDGYKQTISETNVRDRNELYNTNKSNDITQTEDATSSGHKDTTSNDNTVDKNYTLPHKQVDSVSGYMSSQQTKDNTITAGVAGSGSMSTTKTNQDREEEHRNNTITANDSTLITKTGGANVVDQKFNYMKKLRNVYSEFAEKFSVCFLQVY